MAVKKSKQANIVVQQLSFSAPKRENIDIASWRSALKRAENESNPQRIALYDIYTDILLDAHLSSVINKRRTVVLNSKVQFYNNGNLDEQVQQQIESPWFRRFLADLLDTRFWGHSVFQFYSDGDWINYDLIPRKHIEPITGKLLLSANDTAGLPYRDGGFSNLLEVGEKRALGLLVNAAPYVIYKRNCMGDYAQFAEIFGQPMREGIYDGYDDMARQKLKEDLEQAGSSSVFVHPENTQIKLIESGDKSGNSKLYTDLVSLCNAEISKLFLGNTLTTEQGEKGTQALGTVHKDVEEQIAATDQLFILDTLNYDLRDIFLALGVNVTNGQFRFENKQQLNLNERVIVDMQIASKIPVDDDYWYETYDIPKPKNYKKLKAEQEQQRKAMQQTSTDVASQRLSETKNDKKANENAFKRFLNFFG